MYKPLYCGNPLCYPVTQPLNSPPRGQPVLLDFCVDLQLYFMHMQGNKLYFFLLFFFFVGAFTVIIKNSKMSVVYPKKLLLRGQWVKCGSAGSSWMWLGLSQVCSKCLSSSASSWESSSYLGLFYSWQMAGVPGLAKLRVYDASQSFACKWHLVISPAIG